MGEMIHTWESYLGNRSLEEHAAANPNGMLDRSLPQGLAKKPAALARISGSCWIADCPKEGCGGAEFVNFSDLRFFCCNCRNVDWDGKALPVQPPDPSMRIQVEGLLLSRQDAKTRNWEKDETVDDIRVENLKHGVVI